jgi:hypothetical protein
MAKLHEHFNCPNPAQYGAAPIKTVYVRDIDPNGGKVKWRPVGWICTGCGVFRADNHSFPPGKIEPVCIPWQPERKQAPAAEIVISSSDTGVMAGAAFTQEFSHVEVYSEAPAEIKAVRRPGRPVKRISPEMVASVLGETPEAVREKLRIGEIPARKDPWRHWRIDIDWYRDRCREAGVAFPGEVINAEV